MQGTTPMPPVSTSSVIKPRSSLKPGEFIALSASTMVLTALGIDIMLPALSDVRKHFGLAENSTQTAYIIVFFFMGQVAQLLFGILSDRFGRLPILRVGFPLYIAGGIAATFAPTLQLMFVARFVAGMGASAVFMTTIAGVRDRFAGDRMAHMMSLIFTIFLFTPVVAPFLGLAILSVASWQAVFITPPVFAVIVFIWSFRLEESHPRHKRISLNWSSVKQSIRHIVCNLTFLRYTTIATLLFSALSSYVSSSERIVGEIYGRLALFPWIFAGIGLLMSIFTLLNSRFSSRFGSRKTIKGLLIVYTSVAAMLLLYTVAFGDPPEIHLFFIALGLLMAINLAIEPNSSALALEPMGDMAGMAAAVYGTVFFFAGSFLGSVISNVMVNKMFPLVVSLFGIGLAALVLVFNDKRPTNK